MDDQYGLPGDFRQLTAAASRTEHFPAQPLFPLLHPHRNLITPSSPPPPPTANHPFCPATAASSFPLVSGGSLVEGHLIGYHGINIHDQTVEISGGVWSNNNNNVGNVAESGCYSNYNNSGEVNNNSRWPRQETLTLLEIRSRLNSKFKDTNQKAPLWDEVSRIMAEEHGYQRSGKKCKEKFENLYKYYKKTKEGKAGRQDGKHYRFFRQLEAIYGDQSSNQSSAPFETQYLGGNSLLYDHQSTTPSTNRPTNHESLSFSVNSTEFETSSSENNEDDLSAIAFKMNNNRILRTDDRKMKSVIDRPSHDGKSSSSSWKAKVEHFVDLQMKKIMATQETWMEKMLKNIIDKEEERLAKEDEWRKQEAARFDHEVGEFWAKEKAWVEARDAALMGALKKFRGKETLELPSFPERMIIGRDHLRNDARSTYSTGYHRWSEEEISSLIELRTSLETTIFERGHVYNVNKDGIWEEIASKMACLGYSRTPNECKEKWESVSVYVAMTSEFKKKRREDHYKTSGYYFGGQQLEPKQEHHHEMRSSAMGLQLMDHEGLDNSPSTSNVGTQMHSNNFFHLLFGEGENLWEKYGTLKLGKDKINQQGL